jgi:hypothetical protein
LAQAREEEEEMKYFKPELLARCRSLDDDVAEAAAEEWEQASAAYRARLRAIRLQLPPAARRLMSRVTLHDAKVLGVASSRRRPWFSLRLQLEGTPGQPGEALELAYHVVAVPHGGLVFRKHAIDQSPPEPLWVLYNEFDIDAERAFFTHSLLLTGGLEMEIRFHNLRIRYLDEVVSPLELIEAEGKWPLVEA